MTAFSPALSRFGNVTVRLSVELGRTDLPLRDVLALSHGSVVPLNRLTDELLDITANGKVIARGEVVAQDGRFALRIVNLVDDDDPGPALATAPPPMHRAAASSAPAPATAAPPPNPHEAMPDATPAPEPVAAAAEPSREEPPIEDSLEDILNDLPGGAASGAPTEPEQ